MFNLNPIVKLGAKRSRLTQGHHLNNLGSTRGTILQCHTYQVTKLGAGVRDFNGFYYK